MLQTRFRFEVTAVGGCGIDIDNEEEYDAALEHFERWRDEQSAAASEVYGPRGLPARVEGLSEALGSGSDEPGRERSRAAAEADGAGARGEPASGEQARGRGEEGRHE
jgi:hypothetical protein